MKTPTLDFRLLAPLSLVGLLALTPQARSMTCEDIFSQNSHGLILKPVTYIGIGENAIRFTLARKLEAQADGEKLGRQILQELIDGVNLKQKALEGALARLQGHNSAFTTFVKNNPILSREENNELSKTELVKPTAPTNDANGIQVSITKEGFSVQKYEADTQTFSNSVDQMISVLRKYQADIRSPRSRQIKALVGKIPIVGMLVPKSVSQSQTLKQKIVDVEAAIVTGALTLLENSEFFIETQEQLSEFEEQQAYDYQTLETAMQFIDAQKHLFANDKELLRRIDSSAMLRLARFADAKSAMIATLVVAKESLDQTLTAHQLLIEDSATLRDTVPAALGVNLTAIAASRDAERGAIRNQTIRELFGRTLRATADQTVATNKAIIAMLSKSTLAPADVAYVITTLQNGRADFEQKLTTIHVGLRETSAQTQKLLEAAASHQAEAPVKKLN